MSAVNSGVNISSFSLYFVWGAEEKIHEIVISIDSEIPVCCAQQWHSHQSHRHSLNEYNITMGTAQDRDYSTNSLIFKSNLYNNIRKICFVTKPVKQLQCFGQREGNYTGITNLSRLKYVSHKSIEYLFRDYTQLYTHFPFISF